MRGRPKIEQFPVKNNTVQSNSQVNNNSNPSAKKVPVANPNTNNNNKALGKIGSVPETRSSTRQREQQPQSN